MLRIIVKRRHTGKVVIDSILPEAIAEAIAKRCEGVMEYSVRIMYP